MGIGISNCAGKSIRQHHQDQHQNQLSPSLSNTTKSQISGSKTQDNLMSFQEKINKNKTSNNNARIIINTENIDKKYNQNFKQSNIYKSYSLSVLNRRYLDQLNNSKYLFALGSSNASQAEILANSSASSITGVNNTYIDSSSPTNTYRLKSQDTKLPAQKDTRRDLSLEKSIRFCDHQKLNQRRDKPNRISLKPSKSDKLEAINFANSSSSSNSRNLKQNTLTIPVTLPSKSTSPNKTPRDSSQRRYTSLTRTNNINNNNISKRETKTAYNTRTNNNTTRKLNKSVSPTTSNSRFLTANLGNKNNPPRITKSNNNLTSSTTRNSNFNNLRHEMNHNMNGHYHRPRLNHHTYEYEHKHKHQHHHHHYYHQPIGSPNQLNGINGFSIYRSNGFSQHGGSGLEDMPISPTVSVFSSKNEAEYFKTNNANVFGNLYNQG
jgi:hypothetical protein